MIPEGAKSDLGFVKLFYSTCEVDMKSLAQDSPFSLPEVDPDEDATPPAANSGNTRGAGIKKREVQKPVDSWGSCCYTMNIQPLA